MRFVVLHAHPVDESYSAALRDRAVESLVAAGHSVELVRLAHGEWVSGMDLVGVEGLLVIYPTWWGSTPSTLLDWIQRELSPWIDGDADPAESPLRDVRTLAVVTTHGSSRWINRIQGEPGRQLLGRSVSRLCRPGTDLRWIALYKLDRLEPGELTGFIDRVGQEVAQL